MPGAHEHGCFRIVAANRHARELSRNSIMGQFNEHAGLFYRAPQIIVTVPVLLDLLLCHSRAWLPREESRSFPMSSSGIRDSSRAPDTRAGMTEKFRPSGRACHYLVQDSITRNTSMGLGRAGRSHALIACRADTRQLVQALFDHLDRFFVSRNCLLVRSAPDRFISSRERDLIFQANTHVLTTFP